MGKEISNTNGFDEYIHFNEGDISGTTSPTERPVFSKLLGLIENDEVKYLFVYEWSRLSRDNFNSEWLRRKFLKHGVKVWEAYIDENKVNVIVRNIGFESRPNGKKNPIWKMITSVMSSLYEMELENIKERTHYGRMMYVKNGGKLGRPKGSTETEKEFLNKPSSKKINKYLDDGLSIRNVSKVVGCSTSTVQKVKNLI